MQRSYVVLILNLIFSVSGFPQERGIIQCDAGSTTPIPAWTSPGGTSVVDQLSCGQMVSIVGLERGYIKIEIGERIGYVDAKYVRVLQMQSPQNPQINNDAVQTKKSDQAEVTVPA